MMDPEAHVMTALVAHFMMALAENAMMAPEDYFMTDQVALYIAALVELVTMDQAELATTALVVTCYNGPGGTGENCSILCYAVCN